MTVPVPQLPIVQYVQMLLDNAGLTTDWRVDLAFYNDVNAKDRAITIVPRGGSINIELGTTIVEIIATGNKDDGVIVPYQLMMAIESFLIPARNIAIDVPIFHFNIIRSTMPFKQFSDGRYAFSLNVECLTTRAE